MLVVGLAAGLVYFNTLWNGFVFDDVHAIVRNPIVREGRFLLQAFTTDYWRGNSSDLLYRPLTIFSFGLNHLLHGLRPMGFHLVNVLLHVFVSLAVVRLISLLFQDRALSLLAGVLFALHPIHTEAVASIVGRAELLMSLFCLLSIRFYLEASQSTDAQERRSFIVCLVCFFLSCLSKENGIATPALIFLAEICVCLRLRDWSRFKRPQLSRLVLRYATLAAVALLYLLVRYLALGNLTLAHEAGAHGMMFRGLLIGLPWHLQFANALDYFARYLGLLFFPWQLSSDYSYNQLPIYNDVCRWPMGVGALALLLLLLTLATSTRRRTVVFFGIAFFLLSFLPVSNFIIPIVTILAERVLYLPSLGFLVALAWVFLSLLRWQSRTNTIRHATVSVLALLLVFYFARTILRNNDWRDEMRLFTSAIRACPNCANAHACLGDVFVDAGRWDDALRSYDRALEIIPQHGPFLANKAGILLKLGRREEAMQAYREAVGYDPRLSDACDELGRYYSGMGKWDEALVWSSKAVAARPDRAVYHYNLGYVLQRTGRIEEALRQYQEAVALNPEEPSFAFNLGLIQRDLRDLDNAMASLQKAVDLDRKNEKYWMTLADTALKKGNLALASQALEGFIACSTNSTQIAKAREILGQIKK